MRGMKKRRTLLYLYVFPVICVLFTLLKPESANAGTEEPDFYYYSSGRKITLPLSKETIAVRFKPEVTLDEQRAIVESQGNFPSFSERKELPVFKITLFPLHQAATEETISQTIDSLNAKAEIEFANPVFDYPDAKLILTDEFIAKSDLCLTAVILVY